MDALPWTQSITRCLVRIIKPRGWTGNEEACSSLLPLARAIRSTEADIDGVVIQQTIAQWNCCGMPVTLAWYDRLLPYAPYATALIACGALVTAIIAISKQTQVARRRAAIDFFPKTDLDHNMLEAHREYKSAVKELKSHLADGKTVKSFEDSNERVYLSILKYLNVHELVAVGIKNNVFDEDVCFNFLGDVLVQHADETAAVIDHEIESEETPSAAHLELRNLSAEWAERARKWRGKQPKRKTLEGRGPEPAPNHLANP
jgi:hypothetical protein